MSIYTYRRIHTHTNAYQHQKRQTYVHPHTSTNMHTHQHTYIIHTCIHTYIHLRIHTYPMFVNQLSLEYVGGPLTPSKYSSGTDLLNEALDRFYPGRILTASSPLSDEFHTLLLTYKLGQVRPASRVRNTCVSLFVLHIANTKKLKHPEI